MAPSRLAKPQAAAKVVHHGNLLMDEPSTQPAAPTDVQAPAGSRSALVIVFLVVFIDLLGFGIVLPMLPLFADVYVKHLFPGNKAAEGITIGLLMMSFSLLQFLCAPFWGGLSDRIGRRPVLMLGLLGSVFFYALFGFAAALPPPDYAVLALAL